MRVIFLGLLPILLVNCGPPSFHAGADGILCPDGFEIEVIMRSGPEQGSWISMAFAPDGSLFISPEDGRLLRLPPLIGEPPYGNPVPISFPIGRAQGLCWANDSLYLNVAGQANEDGGLHRLFDHDQDGVFDEHRKLSSYGPRSEHGAHAILVGPDQQLYTVWGNHLQIPDGFASTNSSFQDFAEDTLLPGIPDPRGHAHGITMPAGTVWRTDADGKTWTLIAGGMRNVYDIAFSADGDLFGYDADMEWDIGTPWYRPPRLLHLVPGGDYGWRSGSSKLDPSCPDTLPAVLNTDFSSPTGILSTHLLAAADKYDADLLMADWSYGRILAVQLNPEGASYSGKVRVFAEGRPWSISDIAAGPKGALWVLTGGRGTPSTLYRISATSSNAKPLNAVQPPSRKALSAWGAESAPDLGATWKQLGSNDRWLRWKARMELEKTESVQWADWVLNENTAVGWDRFRAMRTWSEGRLALVRVAPEHALAVWSRLFAPGWDQQQTTRLLDLRTAQIVLSRHEDNIPNSSRITNLERLLDALPELQGIERRLAHELMVALDCPDLPGKLIPFLDPGYTKEEQIHTAHILRLVADGWNPDYQRQAVEWTRATRLLPGGASLEGFLDTIATELRASSGAESWDAIVGSLPPLQPPAWDTARKKRDFIRIWTVDEAISAIEPFEATASAEDGLQILADAACLACHRFNANGHGIGPDLTGVGRRFDRKSLLESILEPAKIVSDQYRNIPMPPGLLDTFEASEIADLLLFLELGAR